MRKIIIMEDEEEETNDVFEDLFYAREPIMEAVTKDKKQFIIENDLNDVTHDDIIQEISKMDGIEENTKKEILNKIERLLDIRSALEIYDLKRYYKAGINDIIHIIFDKV